LIQGVAEEEEIGFDLGFEVGLVGGFENDFEGAGTDFGGAAEHAGIAFADEAVAGDEVVDGGVAVTGEHFFGGGERGLDDVLGDLGAKGESVEAGGIAVGMEGDDAVEAKGAELALEEAHFRLVGSEPEFAVEIAAAAGMPGGVLVAGRIAQRVDVELVATGDGGLGLEQLEEADGGQNARGLVTMDTGKEGNAEVLPAAAWADEKILLKGVGVLVLLPVAQGVGNPEMPIFVEGEEELAQVSAARFGGGGEIEPSRFSGGLGSGNRRTHVLIKEFSIDIVEIM
jgi:hypothetical protein